jgi:hypothetical protein
METEMSNGLKKATSNTLVVAAALAAAGGAHRLALKPDAAMQQFLSAPGAVTQAMRALQARQGDKAAPTKPPLIAEAEAFALYLNPPAPPPQRQPAPARPRTARTQPKPVESAPKFKLVGISYCRSAPAESKVLEAQ